MFSISPVLRFLTAHAVKLAGTGVVFCSLVAQVFGAWQTPLNEIERTQAITIALAPLSSSLDLLGEERPWEALKPSRLALGAVAEHPLGVQVLLSELREAKNAPEESSRQVEVFLFDYEQGVTLLKLVDVEQDAVLSTTVIESVHLPLTDMEIQYARSLIHRDAELQQIVTSELQQVAGGTTASRNVMADLQARISVWVPDARKQIEHNGERICTLQRCALVSLFTHDDYSLSVEPVVNLSSGKVYLDLFQ